MPAIQPTLLDSLEIMLQIVPTRTKFNQYLIKG
jgi:hypothetical protein